jgi:hypothetical protein
VVDATSAGCPFGQGGAAPELDVIGMGADGQGRGGNGKVNR